MASKTSSSIFGDPTLAAYAREVARYPMLTLEEERALAARSRAGDRNAAHRLVTSHLRYVLRIAAGYRGYGMPMADIVAEGNLGLLTAVEKFDADRGFRLSTYALWWIKAAIQEHVLKNWSMVRIGTTADQKKIFFNLAKVKRKLGVDSAWLSDEDVERLAKAMGVSIRETREMDARMLRLSSLNAPVRDDGEAGMEKQDLIEDERPDAETMMVEADEMAQRRALIPAALAALKPRELKVFRDRRLSETPRTLEELGEEFGVSRERVRQIEVAAFAKVERHIMNAAIAAGMTAHAPSSFA